MAVHTPLRGLRCFCVAAECLSFKDTARQLYLTPSAVSHQIKQLEEQLGFSLFERQTRAVVLSRQGQQFYQSILCRVSVLIFIHQNMVIAIAVVFQQYGVLRKRHRDFGQKIVKIESVVAR